MIWEYKDLQSECDVQKGHQRYRYRQCRYCSSDMITLGTRHQEDEFVIGSYSHRSHDYAIEVCAACGWWVVYHDHIDEEGSGCSYGTRAAVPVLRRVSLEDMSTPLDDVRAYLLARYQDRFDMNPTLLEHLVGSVFANIGCQVEVTARSHDDGIDVIVLRDKRDQQIGIQVKRYKGKIEAAQIREFSGALLLGQMTKGIFVTMSDYTRGANSTATRLGEDDRQHPMKIELWNAQRFYDAMRISPRLPYSTAEDSTAPFSDVWKDPEGLPFIALGGMGYD